MEVADRSRRNRGAFHSGRTGRLRFARSSGWRLGECERGKIRRGGSASRGIFPKKVTRGELEAIARNRKEGKARLVQIAKDYDVQVVPDNMNMKEIIEAILDVFNSGRKRGKIQHSENRFRHTDRKRDRVGAPQAQYVDKRRYLCRSRRRSAV